MSIVKEGWIFIIVPVSVGLVMVYLGRGWMYGGAALIILGIFCAFFFRDPVRAIPENKDLVLGPCDGTVMEVTEEDGKKVVRMFLSVFNVHLQRSPVSGIVKDVEYRPGKCLPAMLPNAHAVNEQNVITIQTENGEFIVKQIAGLLARRVVSWVKPEDKVVRGGKIGLIKFGSQVDLYVPDSVEIEVKKGDKITAGESIIGKIKR